MWGLRDGRGGGPPDRGLSESDSSSNVLIELDLERDNGSGLDVRRIDGTGDGVRRGRAGGWIFLSDGKGTAVGFGAIVKTQE